MPPRVFGTGKDSRKRTKAAQVAMDKRVSKWGKNSTKRQEAGLKMQADTKKANSKKLPKVKKGK